MTTSGTAITQLTDNADDDFIPQASPDGSLILFVSDRDDVEGDIYTMTSEGTAVTRLTVSAGVDIWGRWLLQF
jgi:Tol biopolymer transport system component